MTRIRELFGISTSPSANTAWQTVVKDCECPFLGRLCVKNRKSSADILIGTCTVAVGKDRFPVAICPHRLLERRQIFVDCMHLLTLHEPGNEYHLLPEVPIPGGSLDYALLSVGPDGKVKDFVGIELQTLDTTGTVWPERQRFLASAGISVDASDTACQDSFGMNWKMTAKTILMQLHHKVETFESVNKKLVLVLQNPLLGYMEKEFSFTHIEKAKLGDAMHFHAYALEEIDKGKLKLRLKTRHSTDAAGVAKALNLGGNARLELTALLEIMQARVSEDTRFGVDKFADFTPPTLPS